MKEVVAASPAHRDKLATSAQWYSAMTLTERISSLRDHHEEKLTADLADHEQARQRLQTWKEQNPFSKETYFAQKLAQVGLTEDDLFAVLVEPVEAWQARTPTPPSWLQRLITAFAGDHATSDVVLPAADNISVAFLQPFAPLLKQGLARLMAGIAALVPATAVVPFDPQTIVDLLFTHLLEHVLQQSIKTLTLELNVSRIQGRLQGETSEERFLYFLQQIAQPEGLWPFFQEYTVLARQLVETVERWELCQLELLTRLCSDWEEIRTTFLSGNNPGVVTKVQVGLGDPHRGGRTVAVLTWSSGFRLVYKPRPMATDVHFQALLTHMNEWGYQPAFRTMIVLDKGSYGWVEFVEKAPCASHEQIERFYLRQGGYLALLYTLEASDFHAENLIAAGEHPLLIDLETLLQPSLKLPATIQHEYPAAKTIGHSVLRVGLLPLRLWSNDEAAGIDISGLGGHAGQLMPIAVSLLREVGTDQMRLSRERIEISSLNNRPELPDQDVDVLSYSGHIIEGFTLAYRLLMQHRDQLVNEILPSFALDEIRCLLRPSKLYAMLLNDGRHPNVLRDALDRDQLFDRLWVAVEHAPYLARVIPAEQTDLHNSDIPLFATTPASLDLFTSRGECLPDFFERSGLDIVKERLLSLNEQDLTKQIWIIRASFTSMTLEVDGRTALIPSFKPSQKGMSNERLLAMAQAIGEHLQALAIYTDETVGWLNLTPANQRGWHLASTGADLYNGTTGIAFFLGYLGYVTGNERYTTLARLALKTARYRIMNQKNRSKTIGAFNTGAVGLIYTLSHLGTLWQDSPLYREAEELVVSLIDHIEQDQYYDIIAGAAGCIATLLSLYSVTPSELVLEAALRCGDHLIVSATTMPTGLGWRLPGEDVPLTGLAHGNAGIALNLLRLFAVSGQERFRETALAAIAYERSLFSVQQRNWPDLRKMYSDSKTKALLSAQPNDEHSYSYMVAWCHGAPGIGLARLGGLKIDEMVLDEIASALETTLASGFGSNHGLCHGDMGNLDTLLTATQLMDHAPYQEALKRMVPMLLNSMDDYGWLSGAPQGVETPGLMIGLAGTGYMLLRLLAPDRVPSVLLLEPPAY